MPETLLSISNVLLFGREVKDIEIKHGGDAAAEAALHNPFEETREGVNKLLEKELSNSPGTASKQAQFARIYAFAIDGAFYDLNPPALFMVHGDGLPAEDVVPGGGNSRKARGPESGDKTGMAAQTHSFSDDMQVWSYDKWDFTIRLDPSSGPFVEVLFEADNGREPVLGARGVNARGVNARGMNARGMNARGMNARGNGD